MAKSFDFLDVNYPVYQEFDEFFSGGECDEHEKYSECAGIPTCQKTCVNMEQWETMACARAKVCVRGCVCEKGYVRDDYNGICVRENACPKVKH